MQATARRFRILLALLTASWLAVGSGGRAQQAAVGAVMLDPAWRETASGLAFDFRFNHAVRSRVHDRLLEEGYYYIDFYGVSGPVERRDWQFGQAAPVRQLTRIYYPEFQVLRLIFYPPSRGFGPEFDFKGSEDAWSVKVTPMRGGSFAPRDPNRAVRRVIIDPGHGGKSTGATTSRPVNGRHYEEKDLVLAIARRMKPYFDRDPNLEMVLTRTRDEYISLPDRIAFADAAEGDLFLSIHLNATSSKSKTARGFEVYYLSDGTKETNRQLEALENDRHLDLDNDLPGGGNLRAILADLADDKLRERRMESRQAAQAFDRVFSAAGPFRGRSRGVKSAAFRVLMNFNMPAILAECGFLDNPADAALLVQPRVQDEIARLLFESVNRYFARVDPEFQPHLARVE